MKVEKIEIDKLVHDPSNARKHGQKNLDAIKGSLARFGQQKPIVVNMENVVVAGNGTLDAAKSLGWTEINIVRTDLKGSDITAYAIADNRTGELAEWDLDVLPDLLLSLQQEDFDLDSIGFDDDDLNAFIPEEIEEGGTDPDAVPENVETRCKPGDLWILGNHRLLCGDSTNMQHVERLMNGEKADMVFTDPPYGIDVNTDWSKVGSLDYKIRMNNNNKKTTSKVSAHKKIINDNKLLDIDFIFCLGAKQVLIFGGNYFAQKISEEIYKNGSWLIWDKNGGNKDLNATFGSSFEQIFCFPKMKQEIVYRTWRGLAGKGGGNGFLKNKGSVETGKTVHPTQKPARLLLDMFEQFKNINDNTLILDLFLGSGSTLIACEKTGRKCYGMEIDPHYCDVIIKRWEDFTGQTAVLYTEPS